ncbi:MULTISPECIES: GTP 3',8-cyclase MoaA [Rossellomorea]|jgi:GTP 3',8-cyclase|uniref:GTP 3',8-cyclase MoaA n=1 Tax=Rossellomorea TaxID=2837508 RepID=UPI001CCFFCBF|nr:MULTISPECIES: GTP 3',8-cyclase MoaA [Rossellomorea]MCA0150988.1 GTP 3',8-cyclase MoaA [Rossellomorea vietnamensis]UTE76907.1 GTP 3',8-cyclase MoaA [Rossellomorea sp. KS-H15a]WGG44821.1 GTP 3',8-cyclase MoaA [Rossellomorea sp. DA94]
MEHIKDKRTRTLRDLRISVTDRCNFRCRYCMPKEIFGADYPFLEREEILSFEEITRLAGIFSEFGVEKIRLTGGEPLLRRNLPVLIESLYNVSGIKDIALTTNGVFLPKHAKALKQAGLTRVNVSLDSLNDEVFMKINDVGRGVKPVLDGIRAAQGEGLEVKVNMVVKKGLSDNEIMPMVHYFKREGITLRFIEFMDVGTTNGWNYKDVISKKEIHDLINSHYPLEPVEPGYVGEVAKRYRYSGTDTEVGFISSVTESFCTSCNRARVSTDGKLFTCLFAQSGFDLKSMIRGNASDDELKEAIRGVWEKRDDRYSEIRTEESQASRKIEMSYIGG